MSEQTSQPAPQLDASPALAPSAATPFRAPPPFWVRRKRPADGPTHAHSQAQLVFDVFLAAAKSLGKWEDEWPAMSEAEFDDAMQDAASIELGGHHPDGTHPRAGKE